MERGLRIIVSSGRGDGQMRLLWEAWSDGRWERLAVRAEVDDQLAADRMPGAIQEIVKHWLRTGDGCLIDMQSEVDWG